MIASIRRQRGVTLLISLIMLTILTLFAAAMIRLSSTNMLIAGNMAIQHALRDSVQQAIETDLNSATFMSDVYNKSNEWANGKTTWDASANGYKITLYKPQCLKSEPMPGGSAAFKYNNTNDFLNFWEVTAAGVDMASGASVTLTQGVKIEWPVTCTGT